MRLKRTHFIHLFDFFFTRHFSFKRLRFSQKRITIRSSFEFCNKLRRRRVEDFMMRQEDMKKKEFNFRDEVLKRKFNVNRNLLKY